MNKGDFVYHIIPEFFGTISNIFLDSRSDIVYYGVHDLDGKYIGSYPSHEFLKSSRA